MIIIHHPHYVFLSVCLSVCLYVCMSAFAVLCCCRRNITSPICKRRKKHQQPTRPRPFYHGKLSKGLGLFRFVTPLLATRVYHCTMIIYSSISISQLKDTKHTTTTTTNVNTNSNHGRTTNTIVCCCG
jgi:hypothetical protein